MEFDDTFEYNGRLFSVRLAFDNILRLLELLQDAAFNDAEKIDIALEMLISEYKLIQNGNPRKNLLLYTGRRNHLRVFFSRIQN
jgi:hypothetical protein